MSGNFPLSQIIVLMCNLWSDFIDVRAEQLPNFQVTTASQENKPREIIRKRNIYHLTRTRTCTWRRLNA